MNEETIYRVLKSFIENFQDKHDDLAQCSFADMKDEDYAKEFGFDKTTFRRCMAILVDRGLVDCRNNFYRAEARARLFIERYENGKN
jgi:transcription initiation factor IIE alpha subunit